MNNDDTVLWIVGIICLAIMVTLLAALAGGVYQGVTGGGQATVDITGKYALPPELAGSKVYLLRPAGFGQTLYAITDGNDVLGVEWSEGGKHEHRVRVLQEAAK